MARGSELFLTRTQKNDIHSEILALGLNPADFVWEKAPSADESRVTVDLLAHTSTKYSYLFDFSASGHWPIFSPGKDHPREQANFTTWPDHLLNVSDWLERVKAQHEAPDLWSLAYQETELLKAAAAKGEEQNTPFNRRERKQISVMLGELKNYILETQHPNEDQQRKIENGFRYMDGVASRAGRVDWTNIFIAFVLGLATTAGFSMAEAIEIYKFAMALLHQKVFGLLPP